MHTKIIIKKKQNAGERKEENPKSDNKNIKKEKSEHKKNGCGWICKKKELQTCPCQSMPINVW